MTVHTAEDDAFRAELMPVIPHMRAFARSLCGNPTEADDLVVACPHATAARQALRDLRESLSPLRLAA